MKRKLHFLCALMLLSLLFLPKPVAAGQKVIKTSNGYTAGAYDADGNIVFKVCKSSYRGKSAAYMNSLALTKLCDNNSSKTIIIPSGSHVSLLNTVQIGSNTKIIAKGATIAMTAAGKGCVNNSPKATNYNSISNVTIQGGTWKTNSKSAVCSVFRLCHGHNFVLDNLTVVSNYKSHAIELIAMNNVTVKNSTLKVQGSSSSTSVEDALQIDLATPSTAPGIASKGSKYVSGQTCRNISVLNNTITGSRGVCANYTAKHGSMKNRFHDNIRIIGNHITGVSAEGLTLYNTIHAVVKDNVIRSNSKRLSLAYSVGCNIMIIGSTSSSNMKNSSATVTDNRCYGGRQGMQVVTKTGSKYKKITVTGNVCHSKRGSSNALFVLPSVASSRTVKNNTLKKW